MRSITTHELQHDTAWILDEVACGVDVVVTVDGEPAVRLVWIKGSSSTHVTGDEFFKRLRQVRADSGLVKDLRESGSDETDFVV